MASITYTVTEVKNKINQFADKLGSDYFTLPVLLNRFETSTWDFVGEKLKEIEATQTVTDDISPLIVRANLIVLPQPDFGLITDIALAPTYACAEPTNYHRTVAYDVIYNDSTTARRVDKISQAEYQTAKINPNKKPTKHYPLLLQSASQFQIDSGDSIPKMLRLTYCKKPTFGTTGTPEQRIVNLPDDAIEKILLDVVTSLFASTGDERTQTNNQLEESFRKIYKQ